MSAWSWPWNRRKEEEIIVRPAIEIDKPALIEKQMRDVVDSYTQIYNMLIRIEHKASTEGSEAERIRREMSRAEKAIQEVKKNEPELVGYLANISMLLDDLERDIRRLLPQHAFPMVVTNSSIMELSKLSRNNSASFISTLKDAREKLNRLYKGKHEFSFAWQRARGDRGYPRRK